MQRVDDYGWKEENPAEMFEPGKPLLVGGNWPNESFDRSKVHPLFSLNGVGRTLKPPYLILAMEV